MTADAQASSGRPGEPEAVVKGLCTVATKVRGMTTTFRVAFVTPSRCSWVYRRRVLVVSRDPGVQALPPMPVETIAADPSVTLPHTLDIAPSTDGCPGYRVKSPAKRRVGPDGSSTNAVIAHEGRRGDPDVHGADVAGRPAARVRREEDARTGHRTASSRPCASPPRCTARTARRSAPRRSSGKRSLTEWFTEREGTTWGVGYLRPSEDSSQQTVVEAMLASWHWS